RRGAHTPAAQSISRKAFFGKLLPAIPAHHRALVCTSAGTGLRWGECVGLMWGAVDLDARTLRVVQVAVETADAVMIRHYPKTRSGVRMVPIPAFLEYALRTHCEQTGRVGRKDLVFVNREGGPVWRSTFRRRVWRPALVRAGLLGSVVQLCPDRWRAGWTDSHGADQVREFATERDAVQHVAAKAAGGLRFHDLRHSYATWLVSDGLPVNVVQRVMGHARASTTLNLYTHAPEDYDERVRQVISGSADFSLTSGTEGDSEDGESPSGEGL
ncbi:MAG TPA: site-specific integrase, partial [Micromonosporaceae bacterium]|nr:site-specific integrase [Micromonosporaceae bacterium]